MKRFEGIFTVLVTAYDEKGGIDRKAMEELTRFQIRSGVHGLVVLGSYGECPYLTRDLQKVVVDAVLEACAGVLPVIVGINERGTEGALEMARYAQKAGADGLLVALPLFYPLEEEAVFRHFETIGRETDLPILYYNYPSHTRLSLTPQQIARLGKTGHVVGAKETIFKIQEVQELVEAATEDFRVFTGICLNLSQTMAVGACGAICPLPNVIPRTTVQLYEALKQGDSEKAAVLQGEVNKLLPLVAGSPAPHALMKEAMRLLGHPLQVTVKPPLPPLTPDQAAMVRKTLVEAGLIRGETEG